MKKMNVKEPSQKKRKERHPKGSFGYISYEKKKRLIITVIMFAIPLTIFFTGLIQTHTRKNLFTLVAILGMLPAAKCMVSCIMIMMQKSASKEVYSRTEQAAGSLERAYELTVTAYEGSMPVDAMVICGNQVVCYCSRPVKNSDFMKKHMAKILSSNGYRQVNVAVFTELKHFEDRVRQLSADPEKYREGITFEPSDNYPDLTREQLIKHTLLAIAI